ncbi:glycosyltransferase family 4 protein [Vibrio parahaemolyticus]|uniref:glycosyltransferase family 4 protein n=1 Tax=Vibrio parahaemolyticus TaxID=670 RepID=UPI00168D606E|nr:glycosyltransferase family 4 protein [Vibrio parahaemolyticus]EGQ8954710.1 glycosyltransferase [Vibrio parahaemolyticus]EGQ8989018.1 glycosyltransferase [Vibrio parahaemolyticus]EGQ9008275.1 glycosyltransferase [Vibrio parahaemolyticus]EGR0068587.1 glycosyltransferase family 4 protein [Vibrio parahaemolyticus]EGR2896603.1 glycosyltransferase [Vibrio parahaemolyticus]
MKVVHFVHSLYGFSGATKQAVNLADNIRLIDSCVEQRFLTLDNEEPTSRSANFGFEVSIAPLKKVNRFISYVLLLTEYRPEIVHFHGADFMLLLLCKLFSVKTYWKTTLNGSDDFETLVSGRFGLIKRHLIKLIDVNNALTLQIYNKNKQYIPNDSIVVIPNGVVEYQAINNKQKRAIIISAIIPRKRVIAGIQFFNQHLLHHGYTLSIIGPDDKDLDGFDLNYKNEFYSMLNNNVQYLGRLEQKDVIKHLNHSRFLLHFSESEGMPNVVLESMVMGCFPITSDMNGLYNELYDDGKTGYLDINFNCCKELETANAFNTLGRELLVKNNAFPVVARKTYDIYRNLINGT